MKAFDRHMINASNRKHVWTESEIISVRMCIHKLGYEKALPLIAKLNEGGFKITPEQTEKGINYLKSRMFKVNGELRDTHWTRCFDQREILILERFKKFTFEGVHYTVNQYTGMVDTSPIYRVHSAVAHFDYTVKHLGLPEVL